MKLKILNIVLLLIMLQKAGFSKEEKLTPPTSSSSSFISICDSNGSIVVINLYNPNEDWQEHQIQMRIGTSSTWNLIGENEQNVSYSNFFSESTALSFRIYDPYEEFLPSDEIYFFINIYADVTGGLITSNTNQVCKNNDTVVNFDNVTSGSGSGLNYIWEISVNDNEYITISNNLDFENLDISILDNAFSSQIKLEVILREGFFKVRRKALNSTCDNLAFTLSNIIKFDLFNTVADAGDNMIIFNDDIKELDTPHFDEGYWHGAYVSNGKFNANLSPVGEHIVYYKIEGDISSCYSEDSKIINVISYPDLQIQGSTAILHGQTLRLFVDHSFISYKWYKDGDLLMGENLNFIDIDDNGAYSLEVEVKDDSYKTENVLLEFIHKKGSFNKNFILAKIYTLEVNETSSIGDKNLISHLTYFDGLGRPTQTILTGQSPNGYDIVQPIAYDEYGRESNQYLPYIVGNEATGTFKENALADPSNTDSDPLIRYQSGAQYNFYQIAIDIANDPSPYAQTIFEPSPLNRVMEQGAPGTAWQPAVGNPTAGKTIKFGYEVSTLEDAVFQWFINEADEWPSKAATGGFYPTGELYKNITTDEEGNQIIEFIDKQQRTILKRVQAVDTPNLTNYTIGEWADTYYIYDDFGNLRFVLPPEAIAHIEDYGN